MCTNNIGLKPTISELLGMNFFIPSYQRGYRWTEQQVKDLLNDINEFDKEKDGNFYCLQPLVVKEDKANARWIVIDGQQRLTTIYLILKAFDENDLLAIKYETRPETNLKDAEIGMNAKNIDEDFIKIALETISNLKDKISGDIVDKIKNQTQVIWYEIGENEDHYEVFKRLNSGKISLSNAELIKALLLNRANFQGFSDEKIYMTQLEMAGEWDRIEQNLHDNSFWYFVNPNPKSPKYNATRIDFIFELMLLCRKNDTEEFVYSSLDENIEKNEYFIFHILSEDIKVNKKIWEELINTFRTIKSWFDNREYYHFVGYLMNQKGKNKIKILQNLIVEFQENTKTEFLETLKDKCIKSIFENKKTEINVSSLEYGKHNEQLHNILLLFNIATVQSQISEMSRYPFDKHFEATKKKWSLEHIHAQNEKNPQWSEIKFAGIKKSLANVTPFGKNNDEIALCSQNLKILNNELQKLKIVEDDNIYRAIVSVFMGCLIEVKTEENKTIFDGNFEKDDSIKNLTLLQGDKNSQLNNKLYPEKRQYIADYENSACKETEFVPICTRNVFFKHYSPNSTNPLIWDNAAGTEYLNAIINTIANYLELETIQESNNNIDKIGLKIKTEVKS